MEYIKSSQLTTKMLSKHPVGIPIIVCSPDSITIKKFKDAGYIELSLNKKLSALLVKHPLENRNANVLPELQKIIRAAANLVLITDYEMLFDPRYKLDVLKVFCDLSRFTRIAVRWCGKCSSDTLEYAEPGFPDYQGFEINKYTIVCVK